MLQALETVDTSVPDLGGILWTAADTAVKRLSWKAGAIATTSRREAQAGEVRRQRLTAAPSDALCAVEADGESAETLLAREELSLLLARHMAQGKEGDAVRAVLLAGMGSSEAAAAYGVPVRDVYYQTRLAKERIKRDPTIRREVMS